MRIKGWRSMALAVLWVSGFAARAEPEFRMVTSFYPIYLATLNVVGDAPGVTVVNMARAATGCLHDYQVTTDDMVTLSKANALVINGAGMESFLETVVKQFPGMRVIDASAGISLVQTGGEPNPHVWVSISRHIQQVRNIAGGLAQADPARAGIYRRNADGYEQKLRRLADQMHAALRELKSRDIVTFHEAFPYFAQEFGLNVVAVIEREPGAEPSAREMAETIQKIKRTGIKAVFVEPQYPAKAAETIARETGVSLHTLDPAVSGPASPDAYLRIMERNLKELSAALK